MAEQKNQQVLLENRERLLLSGVTGIDSYDDRAVILYTVLGPLTVYGRELHLERYSAESGEATVTGDIGALRYGDRGRTAPEGVFRRMLR